MTWWPSAEEACGDRSTSCRCAWGLRIYRSNMCGPRGSEAPLLRGGRVKGDPSWVVGRYGNLGEVRERRGYTFPPSLSFPPSTAPFTTLRPPSFQLLSRATWRSPRLMRTRCTCARATLCRGTSRRW